MTRQAKPQLTQAPHNPWLDWLRFFAALEVVLTHARTVMFVEYSELDGGSQNLAVMAWFAVTRLGYEAVMVFFVLSGFLVGGRAFSLARSGNFHLKTYALDRSVRIVIPLGAALALTIAIQLWLGAQVQWVHVLGNFASLQGVFVPVLKANYPLWSLSYEVWFYIAGGSLAVMFSRRRILVSALLVLLAAAFIFTRLNSLYAILWLGGALAYFRRPERVAPAILLAAAGLILVGVAVFQASLPRGTDEIGFPMGKVMAGALLLAGLIIILPQTRAAKSRPSTLAAFLASFSYSLYLVHMPLLALSPVKDLREVSVWTVTQYAVVILAIMAVAFLFSRCFEMTAPKIKRYIRRRLGIGA